MSSISGNFNHVFEVFQGLFFAFLLQGNDELQGNYYLGYYKVNYHITTNLCNVILVSRFLIQYQKHPQDINVKIRGNTRERVIAIF